MGVRPTIRDSAREYVRKVFRHWWTVVVTGAAGILGIIQSIGTDLKVPVWIWLAIFALGFVYAQFQAFHDVVLEREKQRAQVQELTAAAAEPTREVALRQLQELIARGERVRTRMLSGEWSDHDCGGAWIDYWNEVMAFVRDLFPEHSARLLEREPPPGWIQEREAEQ